MNDLIQKLANQAGFENGHQGRDGRSLSDELSKFAQLIVEECIQKITLAEKCKDNVVLWQDKNQDHITWLLRKHFDIL